MPLIKLSNHTVSNSPKLHVIDELKGIAIILVVISHITNIAGINNILRGDIGVDIFLIISGFLLALSPQNISTKEFCQKKFIRIFPAYWIALIVFIGLNWILLDKNFSLLNILLHTLGIHGIFSPHFFFDINQSFWFIPLIIISYTLYLLTRRKITKTSLLIFIFGITSIFLTFIFIYTKNIDALNTIPPRLISLLSGIIFGQLYKNNFLEINSDIFLGIGALFFYIKFLMGSSFGYTIAAIAIIIFWLSIRKLFLKLQIGKKILVALSGLGLISYEIFLFHQPFVQEFNIYALTTWFHVKIPSSELIIIGAIGGLFISFILSLITHKIVVTLKNNKPNRIQNSCVE